jgi:hypothetical protein
METLLMVAVVLIALAVIAQAGVLIAMYLMSRRLSGKVELLLNDGKRLMPHFESITSNLKTVSEDLTETGKIARSQATHVQKIVTDTHASIRDQISEVSNALVDSIEEARTVAMRPIRQYSAIAMGISEGVRTLFSGRRKKEKEEKIVIEKDTQYPAA